MPHQARVALPILCVNVVFRGVTLFSSAVGSTSVVLVPLALIQSYTCYMLEGGTFAPRAFWIVDRASCTPHRRAPPIGRRTFDASGIVRVDSTFLLCGMHVLVPSCVLLLGGVGVENGVASS